MKDKNFAQTRIKTAGRAKALVLALLMMVTTVLASPFAGDFGKAYADDGATERVATFAQLKEALGIGSISTIIIDPQAADKLTADAEDKEAVSFSGSEVFYIPIEYPLVVSHDVTIKSEVPVNIARSAKGGDGKHDSKVFKGQNPVTPALFNVDAGRTLTIEGDIAMTGEEVSATFDEEHSSFAFTVKSKNGSSDDNAVWAYGADPGQVINGGYFIHTKGGNVVLKDGVYLTGLYTTGDVQDVAPIYIDGSSKAASLTLDNADILINDLGRDPATDNISSAGAVMLKGAKASATLTSGEISGNRADVAGVYVASGATLTVGSNFNISEDDIYYEDNAADAQLETITITPKKSLKSLKSAPATLQSTPAASSGDEDDIIDTWAKLRAAVEEANAKNVASTIVVAKSLKATPAEEDDPKSITISKNITIKGPDGSDVYIYRDKADSDFPLFTVDSTGTLTLGQHLKLSGKNGVCGEDKSEAKFKVIWSDGLDGDNHQQYEETVAANKKLGSTPGDRFSNAKSLGYTFKGWKWSAIGTSVTAGSSTDSSTGVTVPENTYGTYTIVAQWERAGGFAVKWSNGVEGEGAKSTTTTYAANADLDYTPPTDWAPEGYTFKGWKWNAVEGTSITAGTSDTADTGLKAPSKSGTMEIVAQWDKPGTGTFQIEWISGTQSSSGVLTYNAGDDISYTPGSDWKPNDDYEFAGWKWVDWDEDAGESNGADTGLDVPSGVYGKMTIVAKWKKKGTGGAKPLTSWADIKKNQPVLLGALDSNGNPTGKYFGIDPTNSYNGKGYWFTYDSDWWGADMRKFSINGPGYTTDKYNGSTHTDDSDVARLLVNEKKFFLQSPSASTFTGMAPYCYFNRSSDSGNKYPDELGWNGSEYIYRFKLSSDGFLMTSSNGYITRDGSNTFKTKSTKEDGGLGFFTASSLSSSGNAEYYNNDADNKKNWEKSTPGRTDYGSIEPADFVGQDLTVAVADPTFVEQTTFSQKCDEDSGCVTYSTTADLDNNVAKFSGGTVGNEKAFFVQVNDGKLILDGATLEDFVTDGTVAYAAPIVVKGANSAGLNLEIKEGSTIRHNSVGYSAENRNDGKWNTDTYSAYQAQDIGLEEERGSYEEMKKSLLRRWANTETAGAIILSNSAKAEMTGGTIEGNRGDTGAIVVQGLPDKAANTVKADDSDKSTLKITAGKIDNNVGVHHAGAIYIFNGGAVQLGTENTTNVDNDDIEIINNFAWNKGGAIWASEEAYASGYFTSAPSKDPDFKANKPVGEAAFIMYKGKIDNNMAVERGGGIEVMSNHVALIGGDITNNTSRVLGGGIYVEGDPGKMYQLYIENGAITNNYAVNPNKTDSDYKDKVEMMQRIFNVEKSDPKNNPCNFENNILKGNTTKTDKTNLGFRNGFWGSYGNGGGLWLCSFGGNATFAIQTTGDDIANVIIDGNHTEKADPAKDIGHGEDVFVSAQGQGGNGILVLNLGNNVFAEENANGVATSNRLVQNTTYTGKLFLQNVANPALGYTTGVNISGNVASNGGGIAANGTVLFGKEEDSYRATTTIKITKGWTLESMERPVKLKLHLLDAQGNPVTIGEGGEDPLQGYEVLLNGTPDTYVNGKSDPDSDAENDTLGVDEYGPNSIAHESGKYIAEMSLPLTAIDSTGATVPIVKFKLKDGTILDPSKTADLKKIYWKMQKDPDTGRDSKRPTESGHEYDPDLWDGATLQVRIQVTEMIEETAGNWVAGTPEIIDPDNPFKIDADGTVNTGKVSTTYKDIDGNEVGSFSVFTTDFVMTHGIKNKLKNTNVELTKTDLDGNAITGRTATFKVYKAVECDDKTNWVPATANTAPLMTVNSNSATGKITLENVDTESTYFLFETSAPAGYKRAVDPWIITVAENGSAKVQTLKAGKTRYYWDRNNSTNNNGYQVAEDYDYTAQSFEKREWPKGWLTNATADTNLKNELKDIELTKIGEGNDATGLGGAIFKLFKTVKKGNDYIVDETVEAKTAQSQATGKVVLENVGDGVYLLFEETAAPGYVAPSYPWLIKVEEGVVSVYEEKGTFWNESTTGRHFEGDYGYKYTSRPSDGTYTFDYFKTPAVKKWPEVFFAQGLISDNKLSNEKISIELTKTDASGDAITGDDIIATFDLYEADKGVNEISNNAQSFKADVPISIKSDGIKKTGLTTDSTTGKLSITGIEGNKVYLLFETSAPSGYKKSKAPWLLYVKTDGTYMLFKHNSTDTTATSWSTGANANNFAQINDAKLKNDTFEATFTKGDIADSSVNITEAVFALYHAKSVKKDTANGGYIYSVNTDEGTNGLAVDDIRYNDSKGKYVLPINPPATGTDFYFLFEKSAQTGYILPKAPWGIGINEYGDYKIYKLNDTALTTFENTYKDKNVLSADELAALEVECTAINNEVSGYKLLNEKEQIKLIKVSGTVNADKNNVTLTKTTMVGGAKFQLYEATNSGGYWHRGNAIGDVLTSAADGTIELPRAVTNGTKQGPDYWLEETQAAPGYVKSDRPWILNGGNGAINNVYWPKNDVDNSGTNPKVASGNLNVVHLEEIQDGVRKLYIFNEPLKFKKVSASDSTRTLSNVKFKIYKTNWNDNKNNLDDPKLDEDSWTNWGRQIQWKKNWVKEATSNGSGEFSFDINEAGGYLIFEESDIPGYEKPINPWLLVIKSDGTYQLRHSTDENARTAANSSYWYAASYTKCDGLVLENERKPIELYKVDETASAGKLGGAKFVICEAAEGDNNDWYVKDAKNGSDWVENATVWSTAMKANATDTNPKVYVSETETGKIEIDNLAAGTYFLFETEAPTGFVRSTSPWIIKVTDDSTGRKVIVKQVKSEFKNKVLGLRSVATTVSDTTTAQQQDVVKKWWKIGADDTSGWFTSMAEPYNLVNEPKYLTKVNLNTVNATNPTVLEGAKFKLYHAQLQTVSGTNKVSIRRGNGEAGAANTRFIAELESDSAGRIYLPSSITKTASGKIADPNYTSFSTDELWDQGYLLVETQSPSGYKLSGKPWWITVDANGNITVKGTTAASYDTSQSGHPLWYTTDFTVDNGLKITNEPNDLELTKVDGYTNAKLGGAKFEVFGSTKIGYSSGTWTYKLNENDSKGQTGESDPTTGKFSLPNLTGMTGFSDSGTTYLIREIKAPEGYELSTDVWAVVVQKSGSQYRVDAYKTRATGTTNVYTFNDKNASNPDCISEIPNYPSINLTKVDLESVTKDTDSNGKETVTLKEEVTYLDGVEFKLYNADSSWTQGTQVTDIKDADDYGIVKTNANGVLELGALANGNYLLYEETPKSGYNKPLYPWRLTVDNGTVKVYVPDANGQNYIETAHNKYLTNVQIYDLPSAGGMGTYWFMLIGAMMMGFALTTVLSRKFAGKKL